MCAKQYPLHYLPVMMLSSPWEDFLFPGPQKISPNYPSHSSLKVPCYNKNRAKCLNVQSNFRYSYHPTSSEQTMTTIDLRGRDLTITPPTELLELPTPTLLDSLFGPYLPTPLRAKMGRAKRFHFLRTQPIHFSTVKQALRQQHTPFTVVFEERPTPPVSTGPGIDPRPYQEDALTAWLAQGSAGVVVL